jgi:DNA (cytosine-5)-methyltransferase 1
MQAGFQVTGVEFKLQPHYCGDAFGQADAIALSSAVLSAFDFVWASPPRQAHSALKHAHNAKQHVDLIGAIRALLKASGVAYAIPPVYSRFLAEQWLSQQVSPPHVEAANTRAKEAQTS